MRKGDRKVSAPPDFGEPQFKPDFPNDIAKLRKSKESSKPQTTYSIETILQIRNDFESYIKPLAIVKIWRRKLRPVIVYNIEQIYIIGDQDDSWILPYEVVRIQRRKVKEEVSGDELDHD